MGIEPTQPAWKAGTLPLSYTRFFLVDGVGFEPTYTTWADLQSAAINHSATPPISGDAEYHILAKELLQGKFSPCYHQFESIF